MIKTLVLFSLSSFCLFYPSHKLLAQQVINGSGGPIVVNLNDNGTNNGVSFINQTAPNECKLIVPEGSTVNKTKNTVGISTDSNYLGNISFHSGKSKTTVNGKVGTPTVFMDNIDSGGGFVNFNGPVHCNSYTFDQAGSSIFNANLNLGPGGVIYNAEGTLTLKENVQVLGNINGSTSVGVIQLDTASSVTGNVTISTVEYINNNKVKQQYANFYGNLTASNFLTSFAPIGVSGSLTLDSPFFKITKFGVIRPNGPVTINGSVVVKYDFDFLEAPRGFPSYYVVQAFGGGTSGAPVTVESNDIRIHFTGTNENGNIIISGSPNGGGSPPPFLDPITDDLAREPLLELLPIAYAFPGSDLDFIEGQIGSDTWEGYAQNLYQLYPTTALTGVARESFNTTKQFQRVFLEHLNQARIVNFYRANQDPCDPCTPCTPCCELDNRRKLWTDAFVYYGRQSNDQLGWGYHVNTWGLTCGAEQPISCDWRLGCGFGYAYTDIQKSQKEMQTPHTNTTNIHQYQGTFYASYNPDLWFMDGGVSIGWNRYNGVRFIDIRDIHRKARTQYNGTEYSAFLTSGYQYYYKGFEITPMATLLYSFLHINGHRESGAQTLNLKYRPQNYEFLQSGLGLKLGYLYETCWGSFIPEIRAFWLHDIDKVHNSVYASFSELGSAIGYTRFVGPSTDCNTLNLGVSLTCFQERDLSLILDYDLEYSNNYYDHQGLIELAYVF